jgi:hypothetical protein
MRQLSKEPKEDVNETLILQEKMARYAAEKRKELIESFAVFKKIVAEQKIKEEKEASKQADIDIFQVIDDHM